MFSISIYFMNAFRKWRSWCNVHIWINPSEQILHTKKYENRGLYFFSRDTEAEVKGHNMTSVVGAQLCLPQNSSRALRAGISSFSQSFNDHKSYVTYHNHLPFPKNLRLCVVLQAITLRHAQSQASLHWYCWTALASFKLECFVLLQLLSWEEMHLCFTHVQTHSLFLCVSSWALINTHTCHVLFFIFG